MLKIKLSTAKTYLKNDSYQNCAEVAEIGEKLREKYANRTVNKASKQNISEDIVT
jgi:hypothetical protein